MGEVPGPVHTQEVVRHVPRIETVERVVEIQRPSVQTVERIEEVVQIQEVVRHVEVPGPVQTHEVVKHVQRQEPVHHQVQQTYAAPMQTYAAPMQVQQTYA